VVISYRSFETTLGLSSSVLTNFSRVKYINLLTFKRGRTVYREISVRNYHYDLSNNTEEQHVTQLN